MARALRGRTRIEATHYRLDSQAPLAPGVDEITIECLFDPAIDPAMFWRHGFSTSP